MITIGVRIPFYNVVFYRVNRDQANLVSEIIFIPSESMIPSSVSLGMLYCKANIAADGGEKRAPLVPNLLPNWCYVVIFAVAVAMLYYLPELRIIF